ncbi:energy-coupling factor transporter transmembrane component T family protein [Subtercola lobariae]|uniref:Cobalt ABC transporter permease n=1 Tax=Subtercola lobariae TaxID=1588641 RepID=A0A917ETC3_9MICO|nr:energy-coupling factor transporter transmembrane protein EcfT [Subtercola lobariae]GGF10783.1 cobalt ABC transporter permease [Subtercola lobariae]
MLTLYRPGTSWFYRAPAGPKAFALLLVVLGVSLLPSTYSCAALAGGVTVLAYLVSGVGLVELGRQVVGVRWIIVITLAFQVLFVPMEPAIANTARVTAAIVIAALLVLTTRVADLLDALERGLRPFIRFGLDPARIALVLAVAITTVPVLTRLAVGVREAQRARGVRAGLVSFVIPFLVVSLKHADELGDALTARGVN